MSLYCTTSDLRKTSVTDRAGQGKVRYELKTPYRDGTTHVIFIPGFLPSTLRASLRLFKIAPGDFVNPWILCTGRTVCRERRKRWSGHRQAGSSGAKTTGQPHTLPPVVIDKILTHLDKKAATVEPGTLHPSRAPPRVSLFD
mgnify:CR=1 FL=1